VPRATRRAHAPRQRGRARPEALLPATPTALLHDGGQHVALLVERRADEAEAVDAVALARLVVEELNHLQGGSGGCVGGWGGWVNGRVGAGPVRL
jgi:hypothetical protein